MRSHPQLARVTTATVGVIALLAGPAVPSAGAQSSPTGLTRNGPSPTSTTLVVPKAATSRLATSDGALLSLTGGALTPVMVKLDYDSLATYTGDAAGRGATSPSVTGRPLDRASAPSRAHESQIASVERTFTDRLRAQVPNARIRRSYRVVYGGLALSVPAGRIRDLARMPGVIAVQEDALNQPLRSDETDFIGARGVYDELPGAEATSGAGVLIADLDSGVWPEHPSFDARGDLPARPARPASAGGGQYPCDFGDNPLTPAVDPYVCNNKLVSGQDFLATYHAISGDEDYAFTARDDDGHGTHTTTTAGGNPLASAVLFGVDRGPVQGIAPGAQVAQYRVCGPGGCFTSDTTAAVEQAVLDGADVLNFSISGGSAPTQDATELAFLDAYAAGVFVAASAGNSGPGAGTTDHLGPWVTTVAASTQDRAFISTLTAADGARAPLSVDGASLMGGIATPTAVIRAESRTGDARCSRPAPAGTFDGLVVVCKRGGNGRINKGQNVLAGGAVGMVLENNVTQDTETDNHFLPAVHLDAPQAARLDAYLASAAATPTVTLSPGVRKRGFGDIMAGFSSRGPRGSFLKPDVTSTGVQVLAGNTPTPQPDMVPGTLFQAIAGTSMSAPHVAGAAALVKALHPTWTPGQIKSALMTTASQNVVKEDGQTPADAFDLGGGRVDLTVAGNPGLTFDATAAELARAVDDPARQVDANLPSIYAAAMPGRLTTTRTAKNVTGGTVVFDAAGKASAGTTITVTPRRFTLLAGASQELTIEVDAPSVPLGTTVFGQVELTSPVADLHLPVAFTRSQQSVTLDTACADDQVAVGSSTLCTVQAENTSLQPAQVTTVTRASDNLTITGASDRATASGTQVTATDVLAARSPDAPTVKDGNSPFGYNDLAAFGIAPEAIGDEAVKNYTVPAFVYHGDSYTRIGLTSNGYAVVGGASGSDVTYLPQAVPNSAAPNNVLAPFWSDLDGGGDPGVRIGTLSAGAAGNYLVLQADEHVFGIGSRKVGFQIWIGLNGREDISFTYRAPVVPDPATPYAVAVENADGTAGQTYNGVPPGDVVVTSTPGARGGVLRYDVRLRADQVRPNGAASEVRTEMTSPVVKGTTIATDSLTVVAAPTPSASPSVVPSVTPSVAPSVAPSVVPSVTPSVTPSVVPSVAPSVAPSASPSGALAVVLPVVTVAPATIRPGQASIVTLRGRPGDAVELYAYSRPNTTYRLVRSGTLDGVGQARFAVFPGTNTRLVGQLKGDAATRGGSVVINVRTTLSLTVKRLGRLDYQFTGRNLPSRGGQVVTLYRVVGGREVITAQTRTDATGTWRIHRTFRSGGTFGFIARTGPDLINAAGASNVVRTVLR